MTCIATDGKTIAADSRSSLGPLSLDDDVLKLARGKDGSILGAGGQTGVCALVREWWEAGGSTKTLPEITKVDSDGDQTFEGLILYASGTVAFLDPHFTPVSARPPFAIGSGSHVAIGAMLAGASPAEAIAIAARVCPDVGGEIVEWKVEKPKPGKDK